MASYTKLYVVGGSGWMDDGVNPIAGMILFGVNDRDYLESHYFDKTIEPLGDVRVIIPAGPNDANAIADAFIAFFPEPFRDCPSFNEVAAALKGTEMLDFNLERDRIPAAWAKLREEAEPILRELKVWQADLQAISPLEART